MRSRTNSSGGRSSAGIGVSSEVSPIDVALMRSFVLASSDSMIESCHGIASQLHVRRAPPEVLDERLGPVEVAIEDDHPLEAFADEAVDDRACPAAGARARPRPRGIFWRPTSLSSATLKPAHVGVVADQLLRLPG